MIVLGLLLSIMALSPEAVTGLTYTLDDSANPVAITFNDATARMTRR
jgi:hypothetical protein